MAAAPVPHEMPSLYYSLYYDLRFGELREPIDISNLLLDPFFPSRKAAEVQTVTTNRRTPNHVQNPEEGMTQIAKHSRPTPKPCRANLGPQGRQNADHNTEQRRPGKRKPTLQISILCHLA